MAAKQPRCPANEGSVKVFAVIFPIYIKNILLDLDIYRLMVNKPKPSGTAQQHAPAEVHQLQGIRCGEAWFQATTQSTRPGLHAMFGENEDKGQQ